MWGRPGMLEAMLARHAAPTQAGLKTANLFAVRYASYHALAEQAAAWHQRLCKKGVCVWLLGVSCGRALVYVCRPHRLQRDLSAQGSRSILRACGYRSASVQGCLLQLRRRLAQSGQFPHEIGLFLGYPLGDVIGFMANAGKNYKFTGYWKVYTNVKETVRMFEKYKKCRDVYERLWKEGRSVWQLTVAA